MDASLRSIPLETLRLWLQEALNARHSIMIARRPYHIMNAGQARTYNLGQLEELEGYIAKLQSAIAELSGVGSSGGPIHYGLGFS